MGHETCVGVKIFMGQRPPITHTMGLELSLHGALASINATQVLPSFVIHTSTHEVASQILFTLNVYE